MQNQLYILRELEKTPYATGSRVQAGANLDIITSNEAAYVPPVRKGASKKFTCNIVVPTSTNIQKHTKNIINNFELALQYDNSFILFLCSKNAKKEDIASIAAAYKSVQWAAIEGPFDITPEQELETSKPIFAYEATKDIAQKRNFALRLAGLLGWKYLLFLDDDVMIDDAQLYKVVDILERDDVSIVGFNANDFPDHSVTVHAKRWINGPIDSFIGAGALAVKITPELNFFPHIYNEDWFFLLAEHLYGQRKIVWAGNIKQNRYNPYKNPQRAKSEEMGDILGESLLGLAMTLTKQGYKKAEPQEKIEILTNLADEYFWQNQINKRIAFIQQTRNLIRTNKFPSFKRKDALKALSCSLAVVVGDDKNEPITAAELAAWTKAWAEDLKTWKASLPKKATKLNFYDALEKFTLTRNFIYNSGSQQEKKDTHADMQHSLLGMRTKAITLENTTLRNSSKIIQGVRDTAMVGEYLEAKNLSIAQIVRSADLLRYDRPMLDPPGERPDLTLSMYAVCGESTMEIVQSVRSVVRQNNNRAVIQLIIWIQAADFDKTEVNEYRNILTAQLINEIKGTTVRLRSGIVTYKSDNIDTIIQHTLQDIIFTYWKINIPVDHPIFVINSQNELLRLGSLKEFAEQEHSLLHETLQAQLKAFFNKKMPQKEIHPLYDDDATYAQSRVQLASAKSTHKSNKIISPTLAMVYAMKRAHLTWVRLDELGHNVRYYGREKTNSLITMSAVACIVLGYDADSYKNAELIANKLVNELFSERNKRNTNYMIVIRGDEYVSWKDLEDYRVHLMKKITAYPLELTLTSLTYKADSNESDSAFQKKLRAIARYTHWLQNHKQKVSLKIVDVL
jgi:hypothetical protein